LPDADLPFPVGRYVSFFDIFICEFLVFRLTRNATIVMRKAGAMSAASFRSGASGSHPLFSALLFYVSRRLPVPSHRFDYYLPFCGNLRLFFFSPVSRPSADFSLFPPSLLFETTCRQSTNPGPIEELLSHATLSQSCHGPLTHSAVPFFFFAILQLLWVLNRLPTFPTQLSVADFREWPYPRPPSF